MINTIKAEERHHEDFGWLSTRWHFSFDHYYDPRNLNWGALRVFNDDVIQPAQGFGTHPHREMEIVTVVLQGVLEHKDSVGNTGVIRPGEVQVMSAGTGITHSEYNHSKTEPLHLLQLWILPRTRGRKPRWEQRDFSQQLQGGKLLPVVSGGDVPGTLTIDQDEQIYLSSLAPGQEVTLRSRPGRKAYLFAMEGGLQVNGAALAAGDQARIAGETKMKIRGDSDSRLILLDLPEVS